MTYDELVAEYRFAGRAHGQDKARRFREFNALLLQYANEHDQDADALAEDIERSTWEDPPPRGMR